MATYTTNLNLKKPAGSENVSIGDINNNMDTIDSAVGTLSDQIASKTGSLGATSITPTRADIANYSESGNVCTVYINNVSFGQDISTDTAVFILPHAPKYLTRFALHDQNKTIIMSFLNANDSKLYISGYTSGKLLYGSVTYMF